MRHAPVLFMVLLLGCGAASAQEPVVFTPPVAYPADRYEAMWGKNPFTLKTAPAVVENVSFAKDLAIGSHYGDTENPTIVIVNTKTHERTRLRKGETSANGMKLAGVKIGATRKETTVEVTLGSETTELSYNSEYLSQMAASKSARAPAAGRPGTGVAPTPPGMPVNNLQQRGPGMPPPGVKMPTAPSMTRPSTAGGPGGMRNGPMMPSGMGGAPSSNGTTLNATVNPSNNGTLNLTLSPDGQAPQNSPLVSQANPNAPPVPVRRRMISPAANEPLPQ